ncbi:MAG: hypothetical protein AB1758_30090, partial [Candidatus Eremiobacterota bacterium]
MRRVLLATLLAWLLVPPVQAEPVVPTLQDWLSLKAPHSLCLSADGGRVVFAVTEPDWSTGGWKDCLWIADSRGTARQLTRSHSERPRLSPDATRLAFVADRDAVVEQIWLLPLDGGEARQLGEVKGAVIDYEWMPDGRSLLVLER